MGQYTPMIQQYLQVKADYKDAFLFFRLGDFYEMFFEDALKASQELEITLTSRDGGGNERIPMCGVPYHAAANYIDVLIEKGHKVAICEQVEDPKQSKGVVRREVVQLITPGTKMEGKGLREKENNYIAAISTFEDGYGIAYTDLSTGENSVTIIENHFDLVLNELSIIGAKEVVVQSQFKDHLQKQLQERLNATISIEDDISEKPDYRKLLSTINEHSMRISIIRLFNYLYRTQKRNLDHLQPVAIVEINQFLKIDYYSKRNLEITETIRSKGKKGSLLWLLDETMTAMGGRLLKHWLDRPLINQKEIEQRQLVVETFIEHFFERQDIREKLKEVYDLERLAGRVAFGNVNARDLIQLKSSLQQIPIIRQLIEQLELDFVEQLDPCEELVDVLERAIIDNPHFLLKKEGSFKTAIMRN